MDSNVTNLDTESVYMVDGTYKYQDGLDPEKKRTAPLMRYRGGTIFPKDECEPMEDLDMA